jgi:hypothetical protein
MVSDNQYHSASRNRLGTLERKAAEKKKLEEENKINDNKDEIKTIVKSIYQQENQLREEEKLIKKRKIEIERNEIQVDDNLNLKQHEGKHFNYKEIEFRMQSLGKQQGTDC